MKKYFFVIISLFYGQVKAQQTNLIEDLMRQKPEQFGNILADPAKYELQIIYTQIDRDARNRPLFQTHRYRADNHTYFYPASTVKFPSVLLALEKINALKIKGLTSQTAMLTDSAFTRQTTVSQDTSAQNGMPSVAHYAKKILLVSDNDAFNRLYEFVGQEDFNKKLSAKGYTHSRILHRLSYSMTSEQNRHTNPIRFLQDNRLIYSQPAQYNPVDLVPKQAISKGIGYMRGDSLVRQPFDFTSKNFFPLEDQHEILKATMFPKAVAKAKRFNLTPADYRFVWQFMSQLPSETRYPRYDLKEHYDSYCKFLMFGDDKKPMPKHIRVFNKVGDAYGYLLDNAYIVDFERGIEFMLTVVIYCNQDQVFNDDKYDYNSVGFPFLANLGRTIYQHELTRPRPRKPDMKEFQLVYEK
jgi:Beta-lactamase enzyme family